MMSHVISIRKTVIFALFGIAIGLCIGTVFKNYRALELVKQCSLKSAREKGPLDIVGISAEKSIYNSQKNLVFVGVMTAKNFLDGRARAVYDTWGKEVPGYVAFFSSEGSNFDELPVISLRNVDDRYPPQKKSFMMLYYMYEHFIDKFEWFIRADDDVYVNSEKLEQFLRSVDSSKPQFIGQAGKGNSEEFGLLSLEFDENFCMGGPGVILSRETLRRVAPHIPTCLRNLYSTHEDVEVGRCVQKFAGIPCTWNYEMQYILRHNSSGKYAFAGSLKRKDVHRAISLHPVKHSPLMYRLHSYIQGLKAESLRQESLLLHRDIANMVKFLQISKDSEYLVPGVSLFPYKHGSEQHIHDHTVLGISPELNKFIPGKTSDLLDWNFIAHNLYSAKNANPKRKIESSFKEGLEDAVAEVMENINNFSKQRGRIIEFRDLLYGYSRVSSLHGQDFILDLLLIYKKYRGKKMTVPVRRHIYLQRSFTGTFIRESHEDFNNIIMEKVDKQKELIFSMKKMLNSGFEMISKSFTISSFQTEEAYQNNRHKIIFVLPIAARFDTYRRFFKNYEEVVLRRNEHTDILAVLFGNSTEISTHLLILNSIKLKYPKKRINYININEPFSRGVALDTAAHSPYIKRNDILFFIDVDMIFKQETLDRIRLNTIRGKQVYLPIIFSGYDSKKISNTSFQQMSIEADFGYFRQFGYGCCSIYKEDILDPDINGFDKSIKGWGLEDVRFIEKIIKAGNRPTTFTINTSNSKSKQAKFNKIQVFRSPDPSLIHVYHPIYCNTSLETTQYYMCQGSKANALGNLKLIEDLYLKSNISEIISRKKYNDI